MRRLRAQQGGQTVYDRARNYAISRTIKAHRGTYEFFRMDYLNRNRKSA
jgi:hypothetical protein